MSSNKKIAEFPDVEAKLQKPSKQSAFERQKAEANAKRRREAAETAAVYEDFVKSFDNEDDADSSHQGYGGRHASSRAGPGSLERPSFSTTLYGGGAGKRHFGMPPGATPRSGPGSLGPVPSSFDKRRPFDTYQSPKPRDVEEGRGRLEFDDREPVSRSVPKAFDASDDEDAVPTTGRAEEKAISKPTLRLANLPPGTSPAFVKTLIPSNLNAEHVKIVVSSGPGGTERKSIAAIVTLSKETPATEIDAAVSALQNRYLGYGFFLSLHRHLSSAAIASGLTTSTSSTAVAHPFGAKRVELSVGGAAPLQTGYGRGYAPPSSYGPPAGGPLGRGGVLHVPVKAPRDIKQIRMIHKVIESVLQHGPEFEALLMSRPDVQREEKWSWIWDARSEGGIYYRWRLWEVVTGLRSKAKYVPLFEGSHAWKVPDQPLVYEYTTGVDEFVSESEYNSSDDDDFDDEPVRHGEGGNNEQEDTFLNPMEKSKLAHLLARLPTTLGKLRKGDVARITAFAITHSSRGVDEIADMIVSNIELPFAYTSANPNYKPGAKDKADDNGEREGSRAPSPGADDKTTNDTLDMSPARLLGLYVVSDILSSSSTSGVRHAWRYRQLFETALRSRRTFEILGAMADKSGWGRFRAEKWKRSVGLVLNLWEGWCVFPLETHSYFVSSFENPPLVQKEAGEGSETTKKAPGRWKTVESSAVDGSGTSSSKDGFLPVSELEGKDDAETEPLERADTEMMLETGDTDGDVRSPRLQYSSGLEELYSDEDLDGEPDDDFLSLVGGWSRDTVMGGTQEKPADTAEIKAAAGFQMTTTKLAGPRKRMRAVDMFAGSDSETDK